MLPREGAERRDIPFLDQPAAGIEGENDAYKFQTYIGWRNGSRRDVFTQEFVGTYFAMVDVHRTSADAWIG